MSSLQVQSLQIVERGVQERVQELYFKRERSSRKRERYSYSLREEKEKERVLETKTRYTHKSPHQN